MHLKLVALLLHRTEGSLLILSMSSASHFTCVCNAFFGGERENSSSSGCIVGSLFLFF